MRWTVVLFSLALPAAAAAQGWVEPRPLPGPGLQSQRVEKLRTAVTVRIADRVAHVEVDELFHNGGAGIAEGDYLYPLAGETVFSDFSLFQGEDELKGETLEASRAKSIYEEIVRRRRDPALIEMVGHGLLRARVFPFAAGETRSIRLRYTQVLERAGDALRFRYVAGSSRTNGPLSPAVGAAGQDPSPAFMTFTLVADAPNRFGEPFSPTHRLQTTRDHGRLTVRPIENPTGSLDVFLPLAGAAVGMTLATHRVDGEDGYFMLTLSPGMVKAAPEPRDVAVVVDVSGSMSGEKLEQARDALRQLLGTLSPSDRFRLVSFSNAVTAQSPGWSAATRAAVDEARRWVDQLNANGGTNIAGALDEVFRTPAGPGRLHLVIFITDGQPTVGETIPDRIAARVEASRGDARIFTFGVGFDLNTYLLERMAGAGRGTVDYVEPGKSVETAVGALAGRIRLPMLVNLELGEAPVRLKDVQPSRLPDLYAGQELVIFGRYESAGKAGAGELSLAGIRSGQTERFVSRLEFPAHAASGGYIPSLWAARKLAELTRTIRLEGSTPQRVAEARELALRYGLLSEFTSYLVQEPPARVQSSRAPIVPGGRGGGVGVGTGGAPGGGVPAPAPALPASETVVNVTAEAPVVDVQNRRGQTAVEQAKTTAIQRDARTVSDVAAAQGRILVDGMVVNQRDGTRIVAGRRFRLDAGVWTDVQHTPRAAVLDLEPFSAAYFDVLAKLPELTPYWSAFDTVIVAGRQVSIRLVPGGRSTVTAQELGTLVRNFREPTPQP
ncbi:MAG TPA: VWA domain-containing protein [Vicinamibacterales bacterium]|nr:VWA domain-containing protein [Vicinamibacterales bacterium]